MKDCSQCDGYGSLESLDDGEIARGIRDTCYHCGGSGKVTDEQARDEEIERVGSFLAVLLNGGAAADQDQIDEATIRLRFLGSEAQDVILAWAGPAMDEVRARLEKARKARVEAQRAEWERERAVRSFRYRSHYWFRKDDPGYCLF